jgi:hypothetical protein
MYVKETALVGAGYYVDGFLGDLLGHNAPW